MAEKFDSILEQCLSQISAGTASIWDCLARYPDHASDLEPLLLTAEGLWALPKPVLSPESKSRIQARLNDAMDAQPRLQPVAERRPNLRLRWRWLTMAAGAAIAVLMLLAVLVDTAGETLPGSPLHPVKLVAEDTQLLLAPDREGPKLQLNFARRRLDEVEALAEQGSVDQTAVEALTEATEAVLSSVEELPPAMAVPIVEDLVVLIADGKETLSVVESSATAVPRERVEVALQENEEQATRARALVGVLPMPPSIAVSEIANPAIVPEPGGAVDFDIAVINDGAEDVTLTSLVSEARADSGGLGNCSIPPSGLRLAPGQAFDCTFSAFVIGNAGETKGDTVTVVAADDDGNVAEVSASAEVVIADVPPAIEVAKSASTSTVPEPGAKVQFAVQVANSSVEDVVLTQLVDDLHGGLGSIEACSLPPDGIKIEPKGVYRCVFSARISGNAGESVESMVTAVASDDDGNRIKVSDSTIVTVFDILPELEVSTSAVPGDVPEPGEIVRYAVTVTNVGVEPVTVTSLRDDRRGNLDGIGTCVVPSAGIPLGSGEEYTCGYEVRVNGNAGDNRTNYVEVLATDDEGNSTTSTDSAVVSITDVLPVVTVVKSANPGSVPEPGDTVRFTVQVLNESVEDVTLHSLEDDLVGDLHGQGSCSLPPGGLALGTDEAYICSFDAEIMGDARDQITSMVSAVVADDEENQSEDRDSVTITVTDVLPEITVTKIAFPGRLPEPGGPVQFTLQATNNSVEDVTLISLKDDTLGDLNGLGTCSVPVGGITLGPDASYKCAFNSVVSGNAQEKITGAVTVVAADDDGNMTKDADSASVTLTDVLPTIGVLKTANPTSVPEPGAAVQYTVRVTNRSVEDVRLVSLVDDVFGNLNGRGTCSVPSLGLVLRPSESYRCSFSEEIVGNGGDKETDTVTALATDDEGNQAEASDSDTIAVVDLLPDVAVAKTAGVTRVPEPGDSVEFTIRVANRGVEPIRLESLIDDVSGDLNGQGTCSVPLSGVALDPGGSYKCAYSALVSGNAGDVLTDIVTAKVLDDEGNEVEVAASAVVTIIDIVPNVAVDKVAVPAQVPETGALVQFRVRVANDSVEDIRVLSLVDEVHGDLAGQGTCSVPSNGVLVEAGGFYRCSYSVFTVGDEGQPEISTVTVRASDDEGNEVEASDTSEVGFTDVLPEVEVVKVANPKSVPEPGGVVRFTVSITNKTREDVAIVSMVDSAYGDLNGRGDCSLPAGRLSLSGSASYECTFEEGVGGNAGDSESSTVSIEAQDDEGNVVRAADTVVVDITDVIPVLEVISRARPESVPEPGGEVEFTVLIINRSVEPVTLLSIEDDSHGDLDGLGTCSLSPAGATLGPEEEYECAFSSVVSGNAGASETNTVTVVAVDDERNQVEASDSATVGVTDVLPTVEVVMGVDPDHISEPGGTVRFTVQVTNRGGVEDISIISMVDDMHGDLNGLGTCSLGSDHGSIGPGSSYMCVFEAEVWGNAGDSVSNTVTVVASDDEGNQAQDADSSTVTITEAPSVGLPGASSVQRETRL